MDVGSYPELAFSWNLKHTLLWGGGGLLPMRDGGAMMEHDA